MLTVTNLDLEKVSERVRNDEIYGLNERILKELLNRYPSNSNLEVVVLKMTVIDSMYSTNLIKQKNKHTLKEIAEIIMSINFDERVENGELSVVEDILSRLTVNLFSFVSKYCTLHNYYVYEKDDFAIYDTLVSKTICDYTDLLKSKNSAKSIFMDKKDYAGWVKLINSIVLQNNLTVKYPKRKLDWYIWYKNRLEK